MTPVFLDLWSTFTGDPRPAREKLFGYAFTWDDVPMMIGEYAHTNYCHQFPGQWHTYAQLQALCLEAFLADQGHARNWALTDRNCQVTTEGFVVNFRVDSRIQTGE